MKSFLIIISFAIGLFVNGQISIREFTATSYLSFDQDRISFINDKKGLIGENDKLERLYVELDNKIEDTFYFSFIKGSTNDGKPFIVKINEFEEDSLFITPISNTAKEFFSNRQRIMYYKPNYFYDSSINFMSLTYLEESKKKDLDQRTYINIDSAKRVIVYRKTYLHGIQCFTGNLNEQALEELNYFIRINNLRTLHWPQITQGDFLKRKLIIKYNNEYKELISGSDTPYISANLLLFFSQIEKYSNLVEESCDNSVFK